ncbi:MAG: right-handed parallel beta-helix repeat-containing protein, partial [Myxococcales bacterium]
MYAAFGGTLEVSQTVLADNRQCGVFVSGAESSLNASEVVISGTRESKTNVPASGLFVREGRATLHAASLLGNEGISITAHGRAVLQLSGLDVHATVLQQGTRLAPALGLFGGARATLVDSMLRDHRREAVHVEGVGSHVELRQVLLTGTRGGLTPDYGIAVAAHAGGRASLDRCEVRDNLGSALLALGDGTELHVRRSRIADNRGIGLHVANGAAAHAADSVLVRNAGTGAGAFGQKARLTLEAVLVRDTRPFATGDGGAGLVGSVGAEVHAKGLGLLRNALAGAIFEEVATLSHFWIAETSDGAMDRGGGGL